GSATFPAHPPAPVNLRVDSLNFHHILRWDPGSGTPPGTEYGVFLRNDQESWDQLSNLTAETSMRVVLPFPDSKYYLFVQAFYNQTLSPRSKICTFSPYPKSQTSKLLDKHDFNAVFSVFDLQELLTQSKNVTLENLKRGEEYCVQVMLKINMNEHTQPSAWKCTFTAPVDQQGGELMMGCWLFGWCYILTPEPTIPDLIIVSSANGEHNNPATSPSADRDADSEDDDDDDDKHYVNRGAGLSSGESSHADSGSMLFAKVKVKALPAEFEEQGEAEGADGCWVKERDQKVWGQCRDEEGVKEDEVPPDTSSNVNLFSVTLASMAAHDEEEETIADSSIESRLEDFTEGRCTDTFTEEEEEEEEFSLYLRNR
uniref:Fibronectin type-III domain-containing protein n=1 Tax=Amphilophus citrinellus TaxID=61819 RepID=A0A3Q0SJF1_AMPCI